MINVEKVDRDKLRDISLEFDEISKDLERLREIGHKVIERGLKNGIIEFIKKYLSSEEYKKLIYYLDLSDEDRIKRGFEIVKEIINYIDNMGLKEVELAEDFMKDVLKVGFLTAYLEYAAGGISRYSANRKDEHINYLNDIKSHQREIYNLLTEKGKRIYEEATKERFWDIIKEALWALIST